jgi:hypothetical protein
MSSTFNKRLDAAFRLKDVVLDSWSMVLVRRAMKTCICMLRKHFNLTQLFPTNLTIQRA